MTLQGMTSRTLAALRDTDRPLRILLAVTLLAGPLTAALLIPTAPTPTEVALPVHGIVSVLVPFTGILLVRGRPRFGAAVAVALVAGVVADLACVAVAAVPHVDAGSAGSGVLAGGLIVQLVSQGVGTGFGLLLRRVWVAVLADVVVPLGLWALLGAVAPAVQAWTTPFAVASRLLVGEIGPQLVVMVLIWVVLPNLLGLRIRHLQVRKRP